jgi:eukaryotic-like serine/threonine-protein kinase
LTAPLDRLRAALSDRYSIDREIGRGGMATVFLAQDLKHDRPVAMKVLHPELATGLGIERFLREIKTAAGLNHPHILAVYDSGEAGGLLFYTMPRVEGETLRQRLERERQLPIEDAVRIAADVAEALAYAHARGVVHRDIKPENIMLAGERALVTDFGIARALSAAGLEPITDSGVVIGTPAYMSPEQAASDPALDGRSDLYSLGCVVYEMLVGSAPFSGATPRVMMARHATAPPPSISSVRPTVPAALERAVLRALAKAPADRFATPSQFAEALMAPTAGDAGVGEGESIAVLPFANVSESTEFDYLSEGITEDIINALAQLPGLRVAARTSSFAFRGKAVDLGEVGAKLKVATVLEGSVQKAGNRLRVTAQLVKAADGSLLWSERYEREMTDIFAIQGEIAKAIADRLQVTLGSGTPLVTPSTENLDAYHLYLKGRHYLAQRGLALKQAVDCLERALVLDPHFALAHAGFAEACVILVQYGLAPAKALRTQAHAAARRALALAPDLAEAHCARGTLSLVVDWNWPEAARHLRRALELQPRYVAARIWLAYYLIFVEEQFDEGIAVGRRAVELDPLAPLPAMQLGMTLMGAGRPEEAIAPLERAAELAPTMFLPLLHLGLLYNNLGRTQEAVALLEQAVTTSGRHPWTLAALAICYGALGKRADLEAIRDELAARARREYVQATWLAALSAALGRMDEAFALLHRACEERDGILVYSRRYPFFSLFQKDPRMDEIYRRIGFPHAPAAASPAPTRPQRDPPEGRPRGHA